MNNRDEKFLGLCQYIADQWSKDPSTKVGCVIVDPWNHIVATGYNGFPVGIEDTEERYNDRKVKYELVVHAEANALVNAVIPVRECILYTSLAPCIECSKLIIQAGISMVHAPLPDVGQQARWGRSMGRAREILKEGYVLYTEH